jgi:hypothetical protein
MGGEVLFSASKLGSDGTLVRLASASTEELSRATRDFLGFLPERLGDNPWTRKGW